MGLFFWKKNQLVDQFAKTLADELFSYLPPAAVESYFATAADRAVNKLPAAQIKDLERRIKDAVLKVQYFKGQQSLGVYRKARLHLVFTERLEELGFSKTAAQEINKIILLQTP